MRIGGGGRGRNDCRCGGKMGRVKSETYAVGGLGSVVVAGLGGVEFALVGTGHCVGVSGCHACCLEKL